MKTVTTSTLTPKSAFFAEAGSVFKVRHGETVVCYKLDMLTKESTYIYSLAQSDTIMMYLEPGNLTHADLNTLRSQTEELSCLERQPCDSSSIHLFLCEDKEVGVFLPTMIFALERLT